MDVNPDTEKTILVLRSLTISIDIYGNNIMYLFEQAKGSTKTVNGNTVHSISYDILDAQQKLAAKRKLMMIIKSKAVFENQVSVVDMD